MRKAWLIVGACGVFASGCGDDAGSEQGWLGQKPHGVIQGSAGDEDLDIEITKASDVKVAEIVCEREYEVPVVDDVEQLEDAELTGFEIGAIITVDGEERAFELDVEGPSLLDYVGKALEIVPDGSDPEPGQAIVEIKWTRLSDEAELLDTDTDTGSLTVEEIIGEPGEGGVIIPDNEGAVGITGKLRFSASQAIDISFTANCGENDISPLVRVP
jgi:hypothetical protein